MGASLRPGAVDSRRNPIPHPRPSPLQPIMHLSRDNGEYADTA